MSFRELDKLLIAIRGGDNAAFEELYACTKRGVYAFLRTYLRNPADVEDVMQTTYLRIKVGIGGYKKGTNARAWILQIAKNCALSELRKSTREAPLEEADAVADPAGFTGSGVNDVMERVLTEEERRIVTLHIVWKYKHREIAEMLGCPTGTVTSKYKRAVEKLQKSLKEERV